MFFLFFIGYIIFSLDSHVHINLKTMWKKYIQHLLGIDTKDKQRAIRIRRRLSIFYAFLGWNCFGLAFYVIVKDKIPTDSTERSTSAFYRFLTLVLSEKLTKHLLFYRKVI